MKRFWFAFALLFLVGTAAFWRYSQYPLPNVSAQNQRDKCAAFFATRPTLRRATAFLQSQDIDYNQLSKADVFTGNTSTDFQRGHRNEISSAIVFRIDNIKKPLCGRFDSMFTLSFDNSERLLKAENADWECCCLDF